MSELPPVIGVRRLTPNAILPARAHPNDAGWDVHSNHDVSMIPGEVCRIRTGIALDIPVGWEVQVRTRSGMAARGYQVMNSPGTVDAGYEGEICVILHNATNGVGTIFRGDRIAQLVIGRVQGVFVERAFISANSDRGGNGFGSTGR